jgi:hypothetical protein
VSNGDSLGLGHVHYAAVIQIIRNHNRLNGARFSALEFGVGGVLCLGLAVLFGTDGAPLYAIAATGIAANTVPVVWFAVRAGEPDVGFRAMLRADVRARVLRDIPTAQRDTYILAGVSLLPFVVVGAVLVGLRRR